VFSKLYIHPGKDDWPSFPISYQWHPLAQREFRELINVHEMLVAPQAKGYYINANY
jgi:hypothetical protein